MQVRELIAQAVRRRWPARRTTSLKLRLTALTVGLFVVFIWLLVFFSATILERHLETLLMEQQFAATSQLTRQLDLKLKDNLEGLTRAAAGLPAQLDPKTLQTLLAQRPLMHVAFSGGLVVTGLDGKVLADYPALDRQGFFYGDRNWFREVVAGGKPYIDKPATDHTLLRPVLVLAVPVFDAAGRVRAVLSGGVDLAAPNFLSFVADPALTGNSQYFVISPRDQLIIAATDADRALTPTPARGGNLFYDRLVDGFEGSGIAQSSGGVAKLYSGKRVPSVDWIILASLPSEVAFGPVRAMQKYLYGFALLLTLVAAIAIRAMLRRNLMPLEEATQAIGRMTSGKLEPAPLPVRHDDEIGSLLRNFNLLVADRLEYEAALSESEQRFRMLVDNAPEAIFVQTQGLFAYANAAALRLFGAANAGELIGQPILERVHPDYRARVAERIRRVNHERATNPAMEQCFLRLDGMPVVVEASAVPVRYGEDEGAIVFARDIGERKRVAEELDRHRGHLEEVVAERTAQLAEAKQAAELAARAKTDFLATMSHEIRTPLGIIVGLGNVLRQRLHEPALKKRLDQLCGTADHLSALVSDILDLSKIDAGHVALEESDFRLGTIVDQAQRMVGELASEKCLALIVDVPPGLRDVPLRGDALRLTQVLINLVGNAVKFTETGSVTLAVAVLDNTPSALRLRFAVRDTGIGIAAADIERVFSPFEQADASTTRAQGGTGLGLAISRRLVDLMGGSLRVESVPGSGSTFSFDLALARGSEFEETAASTTALPHFAGARVLVADDHPVNQEIILDLLEALGCEAEIAGDGAEALACAAAAAYDLILMDVRMPRMDGLAATRAIRELPQHRETPILAVTANAFSDDRRDCLAAGMNGYISKPFTLQTLADGLRRWLPQHVSAAPGDAIADLAADCLFRSTSGPPAAYAALLRRYLDTHEGDMARLGACLAAGDREGARSIAHQLKGVSGLIGAARVAALAGDIDDALRAGAEAEAVAPMIASCGAELAQLVAAVRAMPAEAA